MRMKWAGHVLSKGQAETWCEQEWKKFLVLAHAKCPLMVMKVT